VITAVAAPMLREGWQNFPSAPLERILSVLIGSSRKSADLLP
jgi:hypothetical protein